MLLAWRWSTGGRRSIWMVWWMYIRMGGYELKVLPMNMIDIKNFGSPRVDGSPHSTIFVRPPPLVETSWVVAHRCWNLCETKNSFVALFWCNVRRTRLIIENLLALASANFFGTHCTITWDYIEKRRHVALIFVWTILSDSLKLPTFIFDYIKCRNFQHSVTKWASENRRGSRRQKSRASYHWKLSSIAPSATTNIPVKSKC